MEDTPSNAEAMVNILASSILPAPSAPKEFTASGYRFEHHPRGTCAGKIVLAHPGCPPLAAEYGVRDCYSIDQAVQLILYVYQKDYQFR